MRILRGFVTNLADTGTCDASSNGPNKTVLQVAMMVLRLL